MPNGRLWLREGVGGRKGWVRKSRAKSFQKADQAHARAQERPPTLTGVCDGNINQALRS